MSDTNQVRLAYSVESSFNVAPTGAYEIMRQTGETLRMDAGFTESAEIRADRQIPDAVRNSFLGAGDTNFELPYESHDPLFEGALLSAPFAGRTTDIATAINITTDAANLYTLDTSVWVQTPVVGEWIEIRGFANAENNGYKRVSAATTTTVTFATGTSSVEAGVSNVVVDILDEISNGVTLTTFSWEKTFLDLTNIYSLLSGFAPQSMSLTAATGAILTGSFGWIGASQSMPVAQTPASYNSANSNAVMNAIDHVDAVFENNAGYAVTQFSLALANNLRGRERIGLLGPESIGTGTVNLTGTHQAYFNTVAVMEAFLEGTLSSTQLILEDALGQGYIFDIPTLRYSAGQVVAAGQNGDVLADMGWTAFRDGTLGYTLKIAKIPA